MNHAAIADEQLARPTRRVMPGGRAALRHAATFWFVMTAIGQGAFVAFILAFYYSRTLAGDLSRWNEKPLIQGYVAGDGAGNAGFAVHVILAALVTAAGLVQLVPQIRARWPRFHRWSGRTFLVCSLFLAAGGLALVWVRGTYLNLPGALAISLDAVLIIVFGTLAWADALRGRFVSHRRWALRAFMVVSAVWFMRIGYGSWGLATGGVGIGQAMDGPFDYFLAFGCYLVPLAILELYLWAEARGTGGQRVAVATLVATGGAMTGLGTMAAVLGMWLPYV